VFCDNRRKTKSLPPPVLPDNQRVTVIKILGVIFTNNLSSAEHVYDVITLCAQTLYTPWKFCVHMGWMTQPSNRSSRQSSSRSWCMAHLRGGALPVSATDSEYRRSSVAASVAGSLHQIYRSSLICAVKLMTTCSTLSSTTVTMSYTIFFLHRCSRHNTTPLRSRRHNLQLSITPTSSLTETLCLACS